jgi:tRNA dimethylallyltransferase
MAIKVIHRPKAKILVILGPTGSGKTNLGVALADALDGEIVSADSRQVYKGLDVGTGKDLAKYKIGRKRIKYHLIDVVDPRQEFNLAKHQKAANQAIKDILRRGKLPIVVGGSGLYLQALVDNYELMAGPAVSGRRRTLARLSAAELWQKIKKIKPDFADRLNNSDKHNPRRLLRYLEIIEAGSDPASGKREAAYDFLLLGLDRPDKILRERINFRILKRLEKEEMIAEVKKLHDNGLSWERLKSFGLEYKFVSRHLLGELTYQEMAEQLSAASWRFAKRQRTWFRRWERQGAQIKWIKDLAAARRAIKKWQK